MAEEITARYQQKDRFKGERSFEVVKDRYLKVRRKHLKKDQKYTIELAILDPDYATINDPAIHWLGAIVVVALALCAFLAYLLTHYSTSLLLEGIPFLLICALLIAAFFALFRLHSKHRFAFHSQHARYPLVELFHHGHFRKESEAFVASLSTLITAAKERLHYNEQELQAGEVRTLRRLRDEQIIPPDTYERAKQRILHGRGPMNPSV